MNRSMKTMLLALWGAALTTAWTASAADPGAPAPAEKSATVIQHATPGEAEKWIQDKKVVILDLRTPGEFKSGHLAGAKNIDFTEVDFEKDLAKLDKGKTYLIHCASGNRSTRSLATFKKLQFRSVVHLDGGITAWEKAGLPVQK
jgi:rhodanese-related sulfurtransferase